MITLHNILSPFCGVFVFESVSTVFELKYLKFNSSYVRCHSIFVVFSLIVVTIGFEVDKLLFGEA